ncbi:MAG: UvrD/REP helicase [Caballeronia mineralivorans]|jgi:superfamily I DNA/RNA helicase|nr:UvrD/REP helicase [Caballeronia mineralivorans]
MSLSAARGTPDRSLIPSAQYLRRCAAGIDARRAAGMSPEYEQGARLEDVLQRTLAYVDELLDLDPDPARALSRLGQDSAVRIMTIHKSKGLE